MKGLKKVLLSLLKEKIDDTEYYKKNLIKKKVLLNPIQLDAIINEAPPVFLKKDLPIKPFIGIVKDGTQGRYEGYENSGAYYIKFVRFCKNNGIPYSFYDITKDNWLIEAKKYDIILARVAGDPAFLEMYQSKLYILDKKMGKFCFPNFDELWTYENKNRAQYLYRLYELPTIPTLITHNKDEALSIVKNTNYPFISKSKIGASSKGVIKVDSPKKGRKQIRMIFRSNGKGSTFPYLRQKDYFYIQKYIDDASFDLRIILIGDMAFGYYRYPKTGDFKASGSGIYEKKELPIDALKLAVKIREKLRSRQLGVDLLYSNKYKQYFIIETSLFNQIDTPIQCAKNNVPGYYDVSDLNNIKFKEGKFWIQELLLRNIVIQWNNISS